MHIFNFTKQCFINSIESKSLRPIALHGLLILKFHYIKYLTKAH